MKFSLYSFLCLALSCSIGGNLWGQSNGFLQQKADEVLGKNGVYNQTDDQGQRQGYWWVHRKGGIGIQEYNAYGRYVNGLKEGLWYKMDKLGRLISIRNFTNGVLNGTSQYYKRGNLICVGHFRGLNPKYDVDSFWVKDPVTGMDTMVLVPSSRGTVRNGIWRYYSPLTGQLTKQEVYQVGILLSQKIYNKPTAIDTFYYKRMPKHRPVNIKKATHKVPDKAKRKIGY